MKDSKNIKVLVIDDSSMFRRVISKHLQEHSNLDVVDTAKDSYEARDKILKFKPDVLTLDIEMPGIDGIEFLKILMSQYPIPTIVISSANSRCFEAISAGAVGFVEKPTASTMSDFSKDLASKIKEASVARLKKMSTTMNTSLNDENTPRRRIIDSNISMKNNKDIIAIGASMGGVEAISKLLKRLPLGLPPIVITQHMPPKFTEKYAQRLNGECLINVSEGKNGEELLSGHAYVAPGGFQMGVIKKNNKYMLEIKEGEKVSGHCPSVDYLFETVAKVSKEKTIGIILTGMGNDGAKGLLDIKKAGGFTIGQNEYSCIVYGMPMSAKNIGAVLKETSLDMIPNVILNQLKKDN